MHTTIPTSHPFAGVDVLSLLASGASLDLDALPAAVAWADQIHATLPPTTPLHRPSASRTVLRGFTTSLTGLAAAEAETLRVQFGDYEDAEHTVPAALFLALDLVLRARDAAEPAVATTDRARTIAEHRGWRIIADVTDALLAQETDLVAHGAVILRRAPALRQRWLDDDAARTYEDTVGDLHRRLDLIADPAFAPHFARSEARTTALTMATRALLTDATLFRQSRESRLEEAVKMTRRRNVLFTLLTASLTTLQEVLRVALASDPDKLTRVEGRFWWNLNRYGRPAGTSAAPDVSDATEATPEQPTPSEPIPA